MKYIKIIISIVLIIVLVILGIYFYTINFSKDINSIPYIDKKTDNNSESLLAGVLSKEEFQESNIDGIIEDYNFHSGVWIAEGSREIVLNILKQATQYNWEIDENGYLKEYIDKNVFVNKINSYINSEKLIIIDYSDTYKAIINNEVLDFVVERLSYVETFNYNDNISIKIINPATYEENNPELSLKEIAEEILINIFE